MHIKDAVAVVTGGANGLGGATVEAIVARGGKAVILDIKEADAVALAQRLGGEANVLWPGEVDITEEDSVQRALARAVQHFGRIDVLVNAAGIGWAEKTVGSTGEPAGLDAFRRVLDVNATGTFNVTRLAAAIMAKQTARTVAAADGSSSGGGGGSERGVVVNVASIAAFEGQVGQVAYSASKGAVVGMTLVLARDLGGLGIRVNTIAPGLFHTPIWDPVADDKRQQIARQNEFPRRFGQPAEFAHMVVALVENGFMNGAVVRLDAAVRLARY